jgi:mono/diheme cytochrome c family protein
MPSRLRIALLAQPRTEGDTKHEICLTLAIFLTTIIVFHAFAQEGNAGDGLVVAQQTCAICHATSKGQPSPNASAPTFEAIANVPGMTAIALQASLQTSHRSMPNLILSADERRNVVAYILSLKSR